MEINTMPEQWVDHFSNPKEFKHYVRLHALAMRVLAVAHTRIEGTWCAYINAVPGQDHSGEYQEVLRHGDKLAEKIALQLFPELEGVPYAW